jgi:hypothetical protein
MTLDGYLHRFIHAEIAYRQARSLRYQLGAASFPIHLDLVGFVRQESPISQPESATGQCRLMRKPII